MRYDDKLKIEKIVLDLIFENEEQGRRLNDFLESFKQFTAGRDEKELYSYIFNCLMNILKYIPEEGGMVGHIILNYISGAAEDRGYGQRKDIYGKIANYISPNQMHDKKYIKTVIEQINERFCEITLAEK